MQESLKGLKSVLQTMENAGIKTREFFLIEGDIEQSYIPYVTLINNHQFKVEYHTTKKEIAFETTYSNQPITDEYIAQMMEIKEMIPLLQQGMDYIYQEKEQTA